ncbi:MAG: hypothetical protein ACUVWX_08355 [Kiritimatiellia bacterium]
MKKSFLRHILTVALCSVASWQMGLNTTRAEENKPNASAITGIHISSDRSVDFFSRETILASILRPEMTDEEKAIACWRLVNRHIFHFCRPDDNDPLRVLTVYGYALCGTIQHTLVWLAQGALGPQAGRHAGLSSREIEDPETYRIAAGGWLVDSMQRLDATPPPTKLGHTWCELYYGGRWHYLDAHAGFFVYTADGKTIASIAEISGDSSLVTDPVRTSDIFMPCDDGRPEFFYRCSGGSSPTSPEKTNHSMALQLRRGETIFLHFDRLPGRYFKLSESWKGQWSPEYFKDGPEHRCAGGREKHWRHYGNGEILFAPDLNRDGFQDAVVSSQDISCYAEDGKPGLHPREPNQTATVAFGFRSPYVLVGGELEAKFDLPAGSSAAIYLTRGEDRNRGQPLWQKIGEGTRTGCSLAMDLKSLRYPYSARIEIAMDGQDVTRLPALVRLRIHFVTQLNFSTLPRLKPGLNRIRVQSDRRPLGSVPFFVEWVWTEKNGVQKNDRRAITSDDFSYELPVGAVEDTELEENPKYMRWLKLELPES